VATKSYIARNGYPIRPNQAARYDVQTWAVDDEVDLGHNGNLLLRIWRQDVAALGASHAQERQLARLDMEKA
jgi:hypothetical protein